VYTDNKICLLLNKDPMVTIIGVPTNSSGKIDGVARGPSALRQAGLIDVLAEDAYATYQSPTGEAADMELGFALALQMTGLPHEIISLIPMIKSDNVALLGPHDKKILQDMGVSSLSKEVEIYDDNTLRNENVENLTRSVLSRLKRGTNRWWLHVDLDVLSTDSLPAVDYPQPGGLNWEQLEKLTATALSTDHNVGWNVTIYNPDLDPDSRFAKRIIQYLASVIRVFG
jgi:arginase